MTTITCEASILAKAVRDVRGIIKGGESLAILKNVLIEPQDGAIAITASNLDCRMTQRIAAEVEGGESFTVEAARFGDIAASAPAGAQIKLSVSDGFTVMTFARSRFRFATLPASDFPPLPMDDVVTTIAADAGFMKALATARHATAQEGGKAYYLAGTLLSSSKGKARLVGTDGDRMGIRDTSIKAKVPDNIIMPNTVADVIARLGLETATVDVAPTKVRITFGDITFVHKLIDGTFPQYERIIPDSFAMKATVETDALTDTLKRVALMSDDKTRTIRLSFAADKMMVESRGQGNHGVDELPITYEGDDLTLAVRAQFLREALDVLDADDVVIGMNGPTAPMHITAPSRPDAIIIVMPMLS